MQDRPEKEVTIIELNVPSGQHTKVRLDKYITNAVENATRNKVQQAIKDGLVLVNGSKEKASYIVQPEDHIHITLLKPPPPEVVPQKMPLDIVYEDEDLLIVNKPADMVVHPAFANWDGTLVNALMYHVEQLSEPEANTVRPGIVHRLDKDTSGVLVVAKRNEIHSQLSRYFQTHDIERRYWAVIWGTPEEEGTIEGALGRDPRDRKKMAVVSDDKGKHAVTHYKVLEYFDYLSLVEIQLETGRTHQIRVHLSKMGHPVFGDPTYGGDSVRYGFNTGTRKKMFKNLFAELGRQCLHAKTLGFEHPGTGEFVEFDSTLPDDFQHVLDTLRKRCKDPY